MIKKKWKVRAVILMSIVLLMGLLAGCGSSGSSDHNGNQNSSNQSSSNSQNNDDAVELRVAWWGSQDRHDRTLKFIELFQEQNPNITIVPEFSGWEGYWDKLATQAAGQNLPDIIQMDMQYLSEYVTRDLLLSLDPFAESGVLDLSDVDEIYLSGGMRDGQLFALNAGANSLAIAVDTALYEQAGVPVPEPGYTWQDYVEHARQLKQALGSDVYVRALKGAHEFRHYLRSQGLELYNEAGNGLGYDDDQYLIDFLTMWDELRKEGVTPHPELEANVQSLEDEMIVHGTAVNHIFHSNQFIALSKAAGRTLDMTIFPYVEGGDKAHYLKPSMFWTISSHSENGEAAAKFIDFYTNSTEANDILEGERGVPIAGKIRDHLYPKLDDEGKQTFDYIKLVAEHAADVPVEPAGSGSVMKEFERVVDALSYGEYTPQQAAEAFRVEAERILSKN